MKTRKWIEKNCESLENKKVVLTGATGGLGKEIAMHLASLNAHLIFACRNREKAEKLADEIKNKYEVKIDFLELDFEDLKSVKNAISKIKKYNGIDVLINNSGIYNVPIKRLDSGFNNIFQVNFLYTYYFTKQLLSEIEKQENSVCVTVSSIAHNYSKINENDIDFSSRKKPSKIYGNSKRFLTFSLYHLFEKTKVKLSIVHPGITLTNMTNHYPKMVNWLVKIGIKLLFPSPEKAALNVILGTQKETNTNEWIGPKIFNVWGGPKLQKLKTCNENESEKIFEIAENLYSNIK